MFAGLTVIKMHYIQLHVDRQVIHSYFQYNGLKRLHVLSIIDCSTGSNDSST